MEACTPRRSNVLVAPTMHTATRWLLSALIVEGLSPSPKMEVAFQSSVEEVDILRTRFMRRAESQNEIPLISP